MNVIARNLTALSEIARFFESAGFDEMQTGGHGEAYVLAGQDGRQLVVTDADGMDLPTSPVDGLAITIYPSEDELFNGPGDGEVHQSIDSLDELKAIVNGWVAKL